MSEPREPIHLALFPGYVKTVELLGCGAQGEVFRAEFNPSILPGLKAIRTALHAHQKEGAVEPHNLLPPTNLSPEMKFCLGLPEEFVVKVLAQGQAEVEYFALQNLPPHPNVVRYFGGWREQSPGHRQGHLCIAMALSRYGDLHHRINAKRSQMVSNALTASQKPCFSPPTVARWAIQIFLALDFLHKQHLMHRDLKPGNILLAVDDNINNGAEIAGYGLLEAGDLILADFGISRVMPGTSIAANTRVGTLNYLSPQLCYGDSYTNKNDVWCAGVTLYEVATLSRPFDVPKSKSESSIMKRIVQHDPFPTLMRLCGNLYPSQLLFAVRAALEKEEHRRPTAGELLRFLTTSPNPAAQAHMTRELCAFKTTEAQVGKSQSPSPIGAPGRLLVTSLCEHLPSYRELWCQAHAPPIVAMIFQSLGRRYTLTSAALSLLDATWRQRGIEENRSAASTTEVLERLQALLRILLPRSTVIQPLDSTLACMVVTLLLKKN